MTPTLRRPRFLSLAVMCSGCGSESPAPPAERTDCPSVVDAGTSASVVAVAAGGLHTCALRADGTVACWGANDQGQLGNTSSGSATPVTVPGLSGVTAIAAGFAHTCALRCSRVECWGRNYFGQLGNGDDPPRLSGGATPVAVSRLGNAKAIAAGSDSEHTCALLPDGTMKCWGFNESGQLGDLDPPNSSGTPVAVLTMSGVNLRNVTAIVAGYQHTCALISGGAVNCWGRWGDYPTGNLPSAGYASSFWPVTIPDLVGVTAMSAAGRTTCALISGGMVRCWGWGPRGDGNLYSTSENPVVAAINGKATAVAAGGGAHDLTEPDGSYPAVPGLSHSCALISGGAVECWGANAYGQVGDGTTSDALSPVPVSNLSNASLIAAGTFHTCAVLSDGTLECWGNNRFGQLGDGTTTDSAVPVSVKW